jgi:arylsulfatase A-like enzyme
MIFIIAGMIFLGSVAALELLIFLLPPDLVWWESVKRASFILFNYALVGWMAGLLFSLFAWGCRKTLRARAEPRTLLPWFVAILTLLSAGGYGSILVGAYLAEPLSLTDPTRFALTILALAVAMILSAGIFILLRRLFARLPGTRLEGRSPLRLASSLLAVVPLGLLSFLSSSQYLQTEAMAPLQSSDWWSSAGEYTGDPHDLNLLLITTDTLRADHLSCYGNDAIRTTHVDALAEHGTLFTNAYTISPRTAPSHASLFTGLYPAHHGIRMNGQMLDHEILTLAEILTSEGYSTAGFVSHPLLSSAYQFDQGFETFDENIPTPTAPYAHQEYSLLLRALRKLGYLLSPPYPTRDADVTSSALRKWLEGNDGSRFFAWIHLFDPHDPYAPPSRYYEADFHPNTGFASRFASYFNSLSHYRYDGEIAFADESIGSVMTELEFLSLLDRTLVVFLSDHGEGLGDHDYNFHTNRLYREQAHVPFILWRPGHVPQGRRVSTLVENVDVLPTVLELLGIDSRHVADSGGVSLYSLIRRTPDASAPAAAKETIYAEALGSGRESSLFSLMTEEWKLILNASTQEVELYDRRADPEESRNLSGENKHAVASLLARLNKRIRLGDADQQLEFDEETLELLRSLGYIY